MSQIKVTLFPASPRATETTWSPQECSNGENENFNLLIFNTQISELNYLFCSEKTRLPFPVKSNPIYFLIGNSLSRLVSVGLR